MRAACRLYAGVARGIAQPSLAQRRCDASSAPAVLSLIESCPEPPDSLAIPAGIIAVHRRPSSACNRTARGARCGIQGLAGPDQQRPPGSVAKAAIAWPITLAAMSSSGSRTGDHQFLASPRPAEVPEISRDAINAAIRPFTTPEFYCPEAEANPLQRPRLGA